MLCALGRHAFCWFIVLLLCVVILWSHYCVCTVYLSCIYRVFMHVFVYLQKNVLRINIENKRQSAGYSPFVVQVQYLSTLIPTPNTSCVSVYDLHSKWFTQYVSLYMFYTAYVSVDYSHIMCLCIWFTQWMICTVCVSVHYLHSVSVDYLHTMYLCKWFA